MRSFIPQNESQIAHRLAKNRRTERQKLGGTEDRKRRGKTGIRDTRDNILKLKSIFRMLRKTFRAFGTEMLIIHPGIP
jgi:hypothetical protein